MTTKKLLLLFGAVPGLCFAAGPTFHQPRILAFEPYPRHSRTGSATTSTIGYLIHRTMLPVGSQGRLIMNLFAAGSNDNRVTKMRASSGGQDSASMAVVARLAAKAFDPSSSKPSSRNYTTRKVELSEVHVTVDGCQGDYNHYRTLALKNTKDRAVSLLTEDVLIALRSEYGQYDIQDGDLGENIYVAGASFQFFRKGERYEFLSTENEDDSSRTSNRNVILEITEKMTPCANICKLPYINQDSLDPKDRILRCRELLAFLDRYEGFRGWYAKVVQQGVIRKGSAVRRISP